MKPPLAEEGELFLYLEPFFQEESVLRFNLDGIAAVRSDGSEVPLSLRLTSLQGTAQTRQRLVASGILPAGSYRGLSCRASQPFLKTEVGEVPLSVSDKPERIDFSFEVRQRKGTVVSLTLRYRDAVRDKSSFRPAFTCAIPPRPLPLLTGYVTNTGSNTVTVFDKRAGSVREVIETGQGPKGIALDQKQMKAYVAISGEDAIEVIDVLTNDVINRIRLTTGDSPGEIALTPDGKTLLTVNSGTNTVSFVDPATLIEVSRQNVGNQPVSLLLDPTGRKAYVFNFLSNSISLIDIDSRTVTATVPTEPAPLRGAFNRRGDQLLVYYAWSPYLLVIDPVSFATVRRVYAGMGISSIKVDATTDFTYLGKNHSAKVDIYAPFTLFPSDYPSDYLKARGGATYMLIDGDTNAMLLVLSEETALQAINIISKKEDFSIDVGDQPFRSTIMGER
jgi:YVTN family beta-propeller protein